MAEQSDARRPGAGPPRDSIFGQARPRRAAPGHPQSWGEANRADTDWPGEDDEDGMHAPYRDWRARELAACDRDYAEFRREQQRRFEADFAAWRQRRRARDTAAAAAPTPAESAPPDRGDGERADAPSSEGAGTPRSRGSRGSRTRG